MKRRWGGRFSKERIARNRYRDHHANVFENTQFTSDCAKIRYGNCQIFGKGGAFGRMIAVWFNLIQTKIMRIVSINSPMPIIPPFPLIDILCMLFTINSRLKTPVFKEETH